MPIDVRQFFSRDMIYRRYRFQTVEKNGQAFDEIKRMDNDLVAFMDQCTQTFREHIAYTRTLDEALSNPNINCFNDDLPRSRNATP